jgi:hypothetical protein
MEENRKAFSILTVKPTGKKPLGRAKHDRKAILDWILKK